MNYQSTQPCYHAILLGMNCNTSNIGPVLIDAGMSSHGWSGIGSHIKCAYSGALDKVLKGGWWVLGSEPTKRLPTVGVNSELDNQDIFDWGSLGHTGFAHGYARHGATLGPVTVGTRDGVIQVTDPDQLLPVDAAVEAWCDRYGKGHHLIPEVMAMLDWFEGKGFYEQVVTEAVEMPIVAVIGTHPVQGWGLWVLKVDSFEVPSFDEKLYSLDGFEIEPERLNCPGHPEHGTPLFYTRRLDLLCMTSDGHVIVDHKCLSRPKQKRATTGGYTVDRGMNSFTLMGQQMYGLDYGGTVLQLVEKRPARNKTEYHRSWNPVTAAPRVERTMALRLYEAYHERANLEMETFNGERQVDEWPDIAHETGTCEHYYGACRHLKSGLCRRGVGF